MNQNLKKIMDELALIHPHEREFKDGFKASIPHAQEQVLNLLRGTIGEKVLRNYCPANTVRWLEQELKRMDENE